MQSAMRLAVAALLGGGVAMSGTLVAAEGDSGQQKNAERRDAPTPEQELQQTISLLHKMNETMAEAGKMAQSKATLDDVADYGERLALDHNFAANRIASLAEEQGVEIATPQPRDPEIKQQLQMVKQKLAKLSELSGPQFDRMFVVFMGNSHRNMQKQVRKVSTTTNNQALADTIQPMIPILGQHIVLAELLQADDRSS